MIKSGSGVRKGVLALLATAAISACGAEQVREAAPAVPPAPPESPPATAEAAAPAVAVPSIALPEAPVMTVVEDGEAMRSAAGHVHGEAAMTVSLEGSTLTISLISPLYNIVGFERDPENDVEEAAMEMSFAYFSDAALVFTLPDAAGCEATESSVMASIASESTTETAETGEADPHDHDGDAADDTHDGHDAHDGHDHGSGAGEIQVDYVFECAAPGKLQYVETTLMDAFYRLETLDVVSFRDDLQSAETLKQGQTRILLPR